MSALSGITYYSHCTTHHIHNVINTHSNPSEGRPRSEAEKATTLKIVGKVMEGGQFCQTQTVVTAEDRRGSSYNNTDTLTLSHIFRLGHSGCNQEEVNLLPDIFHAHLSFLLLVIFSGRFFGALCRKLEDLFSK